MDDLSIHINRIINILKVNAVEVQLCNYLYDNGIHICTSDEFVGEYAMYIITGYYFTDSNRIFLSRHFAGNMPCTPAMSVYFAAHELRHVWQHMYHPDTYVENARTKDEYLNNVAEIDADAFAEAYLRCFTKYNLSDYSLALYPKQYDHGRRQERLKLIETTLRGKWG